MGETLDAALAGLYGGAAGEATDAAAAAALPNVALPNASATDVAGSLTRQAREHYDRARAAQRADDWATYGEEMRKLGDVLKELDRQQPPRRP
jgi:uncharacterized membrane protein (UPF0182 family)